MKNGRNIIPVRVNNSMTEEDYSDLKREFRKALSNSKECYHVPVMYDGVDWVRGPNGLNRAVKVISEI